MEKGKKPTLNNTQKYDQFSNLLAFTLSRFIIHIYVASAKCTWNYLLFFLNNECFTEVTQHLNNPLAPVNVLKSKFCLWLLERY